MYDGHLKKLILVISLNYFVDCYITSPTGFFSSVGRKKNKNKNRLAGCRREIAVIFYTNVFFVVVVGNNFSLSEDSSTIEYNEDGLRDRSLFMAGGDQVQMTFYEKIFRGSLIE